MSNGCGSSASVAPSLASSVEGVPDVVWSSNMTAICSVQHSTHSSQQQLLLLL